MQQQQTYDVVVLGGGPAGYACALRVADLGLRAAVVEADDVGGTCLHRGCVPTRAMLHAASLADSAGKPAERWGIKTTFDGVDMQKLLHTRDDVVHRNARAVERHLGQAGIDLIRGKGWMTGPRTVQVEGELLIATRALVIATGSHPRPLRHAEADGTFVLTSDQALALERVPSSAIIVGGGAVGCELSQVWRALGAEVTILEIGPHLVPFEDFSVGESLSRALRRRGIQVHAGAQLTHVEVSDGQINATFEVAGRTMTASAEVLLGAIGRNPSTNGIGCDQAGVVLDDGYVKPRGWSTLETSAEGVYAIGDVLPLPSPARAHVAFAEGMLAAAAIAGTPGAPLDYRGIPRITHGLAETACVGLSEDEARAEFGDVEVATMPLGGVAKGLIVGEAGMAKVVAAKDGAILGVHLVGPNVAELIGEATAVTNFEASPLEAASVVHAHPTLSEALAELYLSLGGTPLHHR